MLAIVAVIVTASNGYAKDAPRTLMLSGEAGVLIPGGAESLNTAPLLGFRVGTSLTDLIAIEAGAAFIPSSTTGEASSVAQYQFEFQYQTFMNGPWRIFAAAGVGGITGSGAAKSGAMMDFGIGARYFLSERLALRSDLRDIIAVESIGNNIEFSVGVSYLFEFGSAKAKALSRGPLRPAPEAEASAQAAPVRAPMKDVPAAVPLPAPIATRDAKVTVPVPTPVAASKDAPVAPVSADPLPAAPVPATPPPEKAPALLPVDAPPVDAQLTPVATDSAASVLAVEKISPEDAAIEQASSTVQIVSKPVPVTVTTEHPPVVPNKPAPVAPPPLTVYFDINSSKINGESLESLDAIADSLRLSADLTVVVEGHSDSRGKLAYNYRLSHLRAESVRRYLVKRGVQARRLSVINHGPMRPVAENRTQKGSEKNRRAVVKVTTDTRDTR